MALGSTQPLTEMSTRNLPGGKGWRARRADYLTANFSRLCRKCGSLNVSQPYGPSRPVTGIDLPIALGATNFTFEFKNMFLKFDFLAYVHTI
jgi:hypothetical protein